MLGFGKEVAAYFNQHLDRKDRPLGEVINNVHSLNKAIGFVKCNKKRTSQRMGFSSDITFFEYLSVFFAFFLPIGAYTHWDSR